MRLLLITGTPGTGKTTVSKKIINNVYGRLISLNEIILNKNLYESYDKDRETYVINHEKLYQYLIKKINEIEKLNFKFLIIEGHFADIVPNNFIDIVVVLRTHPDELYKRLKSRNYSESKIKENIQAEILGNSANFIFEKKLKKPIYEIDTTDLEIEELYKIVINIMNEKETIEKHQFGKIDWIKKLDNQDRLKDFF
ncbi:MAG: AAA family ATPase [Candidatus Lokiarchaeota archaeon]|nr:AAA family ATPase [Candidatus Lokiarchaeota archaeon]MBD3198713.1 AAA family ATPase [Candidatus Lokiarchaeota archaeon]